MIRRMTVVAAESWYAPIATTNLVVQPEFFDVVRLE